MEPSYLLCYLPCLHTFPHDLKHASWTLLPWVQRLLKVLNLFFGWERNKSWNLYVRCSVIQVPIQVATKLASIRKPTFLAPSPETYARAAVRYIGYEPRCTPYWGHALVWLLISLVPEPIADRMFLNRSISIRAKGRAKEAKKKAQWRGSLRVG